MTKFETVPKKGAPFRVIESLSSTSADVDMRCLVVAFVATYHWISQIGSFC